MKHIQLYEDWDYYNTESLIELSIPVEEYVGKILNQLNIGYDNLKPIGEGGNGYAVDLMNGKVLKITTDKSEAHYSNLLKNINSDNLVKVFTVKRVVSQYHSGELYIILMEKLDTNLVNSVKHIIDYLHKSNPITQRLNDKQEVTDDMIYNFFKDKIISLTRDNILIIYKKWLDVYKECKRYDIPLDDLSSRNIGIRNDYPTDIVFFDISKLYTVYNFDLYLDDIEKITI